MPSNLLPVFYLAVTEILVLLLMTTSSSVLTAAASASFPSFAAPSAASADSVSLLNKNKEIKKFKSKQTKLFPSLAIFFLTGELFWPKHCLFGLIQNTIQPSQVRSSNTLQNYSPFLFLNRLLLVIFFGGV